MLVRFLLAVQLMVQIKFNFSNFARVCHSSEACQRHTPSSLAAVIGLSKMTSFRNVPYVACSGVAGPLAAQGGGQICRPFVLGF